MTLSKKHEQEQILLGIDFGEANIGLAFGRNELVSPIKTLSAKDMETAINEIVNTAVHNKVSKIIMGLPLSFDKKETSESVKVRRFAKLLKVRIKRPVVLVDEYGTSLESMEESINQGIPQKSRRKIDHMSAALILSSYYQTANSNQNKTEV